MRWLPVVGYEGLYEVSERGDVRSLPRIVPHWTGKTLCQRRGKTLTHCYLGLYAQVTLSRDGTYKAVKVHSIVAAAFIGPRPPGKVVRHLDGDSTNNHYRNIRYGTHQENSDDMVRHGTVLRGEHIPSAKLTEAKVRRIRRLLKTHTNVAVAKMYGMSNQMISNIKLGKAWVHVE